MESKINWQKGCPEQSGNYIVTMSTGEVTVKEFYNPYTSHCYWEGVEENDEVIAWCKISDVEPYKPDYPKTNCYENTGK